MLYYQHFNELSAQLQSNVYRNFSLGTLSTLRPVVWAAIKSDLIGPFTGPFEAEK